MIAQHQDLFMQRRRTKVRPGRLAAKMIRVLAASGGWITRREFADWHGFSKDGRECRLGREASHGRIIHGQKGFKFMRHATAEEVLACIGAKKKQIEAEQKQLAWIIKRAKMEGKL